MSHAEQEVVELLGALEESDRRWIIERLSPTAKARLAERIAGPTSADTRELEQCEARVASADAPSMLRVLRDEPGWLVKAVLQLSDWPWRKLFVQSLPARMRMDVAQAWANEPAPGGFALGRSAKSWLLRELSARLVALPPESRLDSRFAALLARATRKVVRQ